MSLQQLPDYNPNEERVQQSMANLQLSPIPAGILPGHPSHVNVQQFQIAQMQSGAIRKNLDVNLESRQPTADDGATSDHTRQDGNVETQMEHRLRSTIAREGALAESTMKDVSEMNIKSNEINDLANKTGSQFSGLPKPPNLSMDFKLKKQETMQEQYESNDS